MLIKPVIKGTMDLGINSKLPNRPKPQPKSQILFNKKSHLQDFFGRTLGVVLR